MCRRRFWPARASGATAEGAADLPGAGGARGWGWLGAATARLPSPGRERAQADQGGESNRGGGDRVPDVTGLGELQPAGDRRSVRVAGEQGAQERHAEDTANLADSAGDRGGH